MDNQYYQMMINNAAAYLYQSDPLNEDTINAFRISEVLAILTGKLKEDIILDIFNVHSKNNKYD